MWANSGYLGIFLLQRVFKFDPPFRPGSKLKRVTPPGQKIEKIIVSRIVFLWQYLATDLYFLVAEQLNTRPCVLCVCLFVYLYVLRFGYGFIGQYNNHHIKEIK